jgi:integrase
MPDVLAMALKAHRRALMERQANGFKDGWVFPSETGWPVYASTLQKPLKRALAAAGITERFTIHGFRRTFNNLVRPFVVDPLLGAPVRMRASDARPGA